LPSIDGVASRSLAGSALSAVTVVSDAVSFGSLNNRVLNFSSFWLLSSLFSVV